MLDYEWIKRCFKCVFFAIICNRKTVKKKFCAVYKLGIIFNSITQEDLEVKIINSFQKYRQKLPKISVNRTIKVVSI